ncbi:hypothetical protein AGMMS49928_05010 [Spirochaetia bacterium]|nr:hypothetical protein AGMMS49928_05010 [Spirochaetia bacterium]
MKKMAFCIVPLIMAIMGCASGGAPAETTNSSSPGMELDAAIKQATAQMETKIPSKTMVALVSVASPSTAFSTQVLQRLEVAIVSSGKLVVVDRANLDKVRAEQGFQLSGEVDDESAKSIGKLLGAGAIVTGSLTDLGDVYSLTLKAINIDTATVAVSYLADLTKSARVETLLASGGGAASGGGTASASGGQPGRPSAQAVSTEKSAAQTKTAEPAAPVRFTVTFDANGASGGAPPEQTVQNGESITIPDKGTMARPRGTFGGWNTRTDGTGTLYVVGDTFIVNFNIQLYAQWIEKVYKIGDTGPAGGIIFYDKGNDSGGWRYLEAAPASTEGKALQWSVSFFDTGAIGVEVGTGKQNTRNIMDASVQAAVNAPAARFCDRLEYGGYDDWYLPSKNELGLMYMNLKVDGIGGFSGEWYWSSSEVNGGIAWEQRFSNGHQSDDWRNKVNGRPVRAIRQF